MPEPRVVRVDPVGLPSIGKALWAAQDLLLDLDSRDDVPEEVAAKATALREAMKELGLEGDE